MLSLVLRSTSCRALAGCLRQSTACLTLYDGKFGHVRHFSDAEALQTREQPAATSSAWGHASRILWDRFDREISSSAAARGTIRQQPDVSPQLKAHISEFINQAGALSGPEQLQRCLGHIQGLQASGAQLPLEVMQAVTSSCREDGQWLLVECGEWVQYKDWSGPARAFLQVWSLGGLVDYDVWELGPDWLLTGARFSSASAFERYTTRASHQKGLSSCSVMTNPYGRTLPSFRCGQWLSVKYGVQRKLRSKQHVTDSGSSSSRGSVQRARLNRLLSYSGGELPLGNAAMAALAAAESAAVGPAPVYSWPVEAPPMLPAKLEMALQRRQMRAKLLQDIASGRVNLADTHTPLANLLQCHPAVSRADSCSSSSSSSTKAAKLAAASQLPARLQLYDMLELEQQQDGSASVPDASQPFTLTLRNGADGQDYVVAHYEPHALAWRSASKAALLCEVYGSNSLMSRSSAPRQELMAMGGLRLPRGKAQKVGRYAGDTGCEPDQFSLACWPDLATAGGFRAISEVWMNTLPGLVYSGSFQARRQLVGDPCASLGSMYPTPSLMGSPFTTLAVTQNYHSHLHCEPEEHPFSFITWLDVLSAGTTMEVGHFWLTHALAFAPRHGSALYIDVRLVTHCSDSCTVRGAQSELEGRYGAALFIKPAVYRTNLLAWAEFDRHQQQVAVETRQQTLFAASKLRGLN